jgi:hypothetical protein
VDAGGVAGLLATSEACVVEAFEEDELAGELDGGMDVMNGV